MTPSSSQRLFSPFSSMRSNGAEHQEAARTDVPAQPAVHNDNRYPVDDRSPPTVTSFSPVSQAVSYRLSYAGSPQLGGNGLNNGEPIINSRINSVAGEGTEIFMSRTDRTLNGLVEDDTPLSRMRMIQTPRGSFVMPRSPQGPSATRNPPIAHGSATPFAVAPLPTVVPSNPAESAPAPIPSLATQVPLPADLPLQHPYPERHYRQAEFLRSPGRSRRLRHLANLLNRSQFWK